MRWQRVNGMPAVPPTRSQVYRQVGGAVMMSLIRTSERVQDSGAAAVKARFLLDKWRMTIGDIELAESSCFRLDIVRSEQVRLLSGVRGWGKGSGRHVFVWKHEG